MAKSRDNFAQKIGGLSVHKLSHGRQTQTSRVGPFTNFMFITQSFSVSGGWEVIAQDIFQDILAFIFTTPPIVSPTQGTPYALPYRRFVGVLTDANARLGADVDRYTFIVVDLHHLLLVGLPAHFESYMPSQAVQPLCRPCRLQESVTRRRTFSDQPEISSSLTSELKTELESSLALFRSYMGKLGFSIEARSISVEIAPGVIYKGIRCCLLSRHCFDCRYECVCSRQSIRAASVGLLVTAHGDNTVSRILGHRVRTCDVFPLQLSESSQGSRSSFCGRTRRVPATKPRE